MLVTSVMEERRATESGKEVESSRPSGSSSSTRRCSAGCTAAVLSDEVDAGLGKTTTDGDLFIGVRRKKDAEEMREDSQGRAEDSTRSTRCSRLRYGRGGPRDRWQPNVMKLATEERLSPLPAEGSPLSPVIIGSGENAAFPHARPH